MHSERVAGESFRDNEANPRLITAGNMTSLGADGIEGGGRDTIFRSWAALGELEPWPSVAGAQPGEGAVLQELRRSSQRQRCCHSVSPSHKRGRKPPISLILTSLFSPLPKPAEKPVGKRS